MIAKKILELQNFERGLDAKKALGVGINTPHGAEIIVKKAYNILKKMEDLQSSFDVDIIVGDGLELNHDEKWKTISFELNLLDYDSSFDVGYQYEYNEEDDIKTGWFIQDLGGDYYKEFKDFKEILNYIFELLDQENIKGAISLYEDKKKNIDKYITYLRELDNMNI